MIAMHKPGFLLRRAVLAACAAAIGLPLLAVAAPAAASSRQTVPVSESAALAASARRGLPATITGIVVGTNGLPVAGACVSAVGPVAAPASAGRALGVAPRASSSETVTAAPDGRFNLTGLTAGSYQLAYRDCAAPSRYLTIWSGAALSQESAATVRVAAGQVRDVPAMMLRPADPATMLATQASWQRLLAASDAQLPAAAAAGKGAITGTVTGAGRPLRGICVRVYSNSTALGYAATTSRTGSYAVHNIRPGRYVVVFEPYDYGPVKTCTDGGNWLEQWYRGKTNPLGFNAALIRVAAGKTVTGIDAKLVRGGEISGRVTTRSGKGLRGICVLAGVVIDHMGGEIFIAATGRKGLYQLHGLFPGSYSFDFATGCNYNANYAPANPPPLRLRSTQHATLNVRLAVGGIVQGTVRLGSKSGRPLAGICVYDDIGTQASSGAGGRFRITGLTTGPAQLYFSAGCGNNGDYMSESINVRATEGKVTGGVVAVLQPGAQISGKVTNSAGAGLGGMCIYFTGPLPPVLYFATDPDGTYLISQLPANSYELGFTNGCGNKGNYAPWYYDDRDDPSLATPIVLAKGGARVINATMQVGGEIVGTVTDSSGHPLSGICITADAQPLLFGYGASVNSYRGHFHITGLEAGQYLVDFGCGLGGRYGDQWYDGAASYTAGDLVSVPAGQTTGVNAVLRPGGTISGVVTGESGAPLGGVCVEALSTQVRAQAVVLTELSDLFATNSRGGYQITGLAAGSYRVLFWPCQGDYRYASQWYRDAATETRALPVTVRSGVHVTGIDTRLVIGGTIAGRVVGGSGKPLGGVCVLAYNQANNLYTYASTTKDGTYQFSSLSTGGYTVTANPWQANDPALSYANFSGCEAGLNLVPATKHFNVVAGGVTVGPEPMTLRPGGSVSGLITTAGNPAVPVADECAEVTSASADSTGTGAISGQALSAVGGSYKATGLAPGTYKVYFGDPDCGYGPPDLAPQWYKDQPSQATAATITVRVGQTTTDIDAALPADGVITGSVSGPSGTAVSGACVTAYPTGAGSYPIVAVSSGRGGYELIGLLPGRYRVEFSAGCGAVGYEDQWWHDASSRGSATVISVTAGQVVSGISASLTL